MFDKLKPYAIFILGESDEETHIVINTNEHHTFKDVLFFDDATRCFNKYFELLRSGVKCFVLNTHSVNQAFLENEMDLIAIEGGFYAENIKSGSVKS